MLLRLTSIDSYFVAISHSILWLPPFPRKTDMILTLALFCGVIMDAYIDFCVSPWLTEPN